MSGRNQILILAIFTITIGLIIYLSINYDVCPAGLIAFGVSSDASTRLFWWIWPAVWISLVVLLLDRNRFTDKYTDRLILCCQYLTLALLPRVIFLWLSVYILFPYKDILPSLDVLPQDAEFNIQLLVIGASGGIPESISFLIYGLALVTLLVQYLFIRVIYNARYKLELISIITIITLTQQLITAQRIILCIYLGLPAILLIVEGYLLLFKVRYNETLNT